MSKTIELSEELISNATRYSHILPRSVPEQIEHWAKIGRIAEENPDMPYEFIQGILIAMDEVAEEDVVDYKFG